MIDESRLREVFDAELEARHAYEQAKVERYLHHRETNNHSQAENLAAMDTLDLRHAWDRAKNERTIVCIVLGCWRPTDYDVVHLASNG